MSNRIVHGAQHATCYAQALIDTQTDKLVEIRALSDSMPSTIGSRHRYVTLWSTTGRDYHEAAEKMRLVLRGIRVNTNASVSIE